MTFENRGHAGKSRPRFDPVRQEWSVRTGPSTWLVWQHGTRPGDNERLAAVAARELPREENPN